LHGHAGDGGALAGAQESFIALLVLADIRSEGWVILFSLGLAVPSAGH
jgi:hypothetical protein